MTIKKCLALAAVAVILLATAPAFAGWGANWTTGSVIGQGVVDVPAAKVKAVVTQKGCKNFDEGDHDCDHDDHDHSGHDDHGSVQLMSYNAIDNNSLANPKNGVPGIVFCKKPNDPDSTIYHGIKHVTFPLQFSGSDTPNGGGGFTIHASPSQSTLNSVFNAKSLCKNPNADNGPDDKLKVIVDFVPQSFSTTLSVYDSHGHFIKSKTYDCEISWADLDSLGYHQQKPYTCHVR